MSSSQSQSAAHGINDSVEQDISLTKHSSSNSLFELAGKATSFKWSRPLPIFTATSSRGSIPHLTPDNIRQHARIPSVHIGLEDFITSHVKTSPILSIEPTLQQYLVYPENTTLILSARRANPVPINASWDNRIEVNTVDGRSTLDIETFVNAVHKVHLRQNDVVISIPDVTEAPGVKRLAKMVERTRRWLTMLLQSNVFSLKWYD